MKCAMYSCSSNQSMLKLYFSISVYHEANKNLMNIISEHRVAVIWTGSLEYVRARERF